MAKVNGLGWTTCSVDTSGGSLKALVNDVNSLEFSTPRAVIEVTGLDVSAMERLHGLADFSITLNFTANFAADHVHDVFKVLDNVRTVTQVVAAQTLSNECLFTDYALNRGTDGSLTGTAPAVLASGIVPTWS